MPSTSFIGFRPTSPALIMDFKNKNPLQFRIIKNETPLIIPKGKKLKPAQLIAGAAFRFLGLYDLPSNYVDTSFLDSHDCMDLPFEGFQLINKLIEYKELAKKGEISTNNISKYKSDLTTSFSDKNILSFSIVMQEKEVVVAYNTSESEAYEKFILLIKHPENNISFLKTIYGYDTCSYIQIFNALFDEIKLSYVRLYLKPLQLIILKNF